MTDRWMEEAYDALRSAVESFSVKDGSTLSGWDKAVSIVATVLSAAHEAGRREEREACAEVADNERAVWDGDFSIVAFSARKAAEDIAAAIRSREAVE